MDFKDHNRNLRIIGKVFIIISLVSIPICIFSFLEILNKSDFRMGTHEIDFFFLHTDTPLSLLYRIPLIYLIGSIVFLISGISLALEKYQAKNLAMIPAVLLLFQFSIGTALGIYMIYALHHKEENKVVEVD